jgi:hypothetical protein
MRTAFSSATVALALGLSALLGTGHCADLSEGHRSLVQPINTAALAVGGTCPVGDRSIRLLYSDCRSDVALGALSVLGG